jgi:hypothetical protein
MTSRRITTAALDGALRLFRQPVDMAVARLPGTRNGVGAAARLTVDRADATIRSVLAMALRDPRLSEDARRRKAAAQERERAVELRDQARAADASAEVRVQESHEAATRRREQARNRAASRGKQAARTQQARGRRAQETERQRLRFSQEQEARAHQQLEAKESKDRLPGVREQAEALQEHEVAVAQADEARRVGEAAARVKAERKQDEGAG